MADCLAEHWTHASLATTRATVIPDGCRDAILVLRDDAPPRWRWFDLADHAVTVDLEAGVTLHGFRFLPGTRFEAAAYPALERLPADPDTAAALLGETARRCARVGEALDALARGHGRIADHARDLGVGERRLHRLVTAATGRPPLFWLRLARARRTARTLCAAPVDLAGLAVECGYADQAHLTRDMRAWFGLSPRALGAAPALAAQLGAPAFA